MMLRADGEPAAVRDISAKGTATRRRPDRSKLGSGAAFRRRLVQDQRSGRKRDLAAKPLEVVPPEDDHDVRRVARAADLPRRDPHGGGCLAAPDLRPVRLRLDDVKTLVGRRLREQIAERDDSVTARIPPP